MIMTLRKDFLFCLQPTPRKGVHARWGRTAFLLVLLAKMRSSVYADFHEGQPTLVNIVGVDD